MKILHLSYKDTSEGAAIAAERLSKALIRSGVDSKLLVQTQLTDQPFVRSISIGKLDKVASFFRVRVDIIINKLFIRNSIEYFTLPIIGSNVNRNKLIKESDIIHLHWVNRGFVSIETLNKLSKFNKPIVWTLHDSWVFTGGCHMTGECEQYLIGCPKCEYMRIKNVSRAFSLLKGNAYKKLNISFIAPSSWMNNKAESSYLLKDRKVSVIPNCLDIDIFKPIDKSLAKEILGLRKDRPIVLFFMSRNIRKGNDFINQAILKLQKDAHYEYVSFGSSYIYEEIFKSKDIKCFGRVVDSQMLALLYSAADVYVSPALEEPFGQTFTESMACGTPCVGFDYSGPKDIIEDRKSVV